MLRPTYHDLIHSNNSGREDREKDVESRYSVVIASAKRARQIIDGSEPLLPGEEGKKPLSIAIEEISKNVVTIERGSLEEDGPDSLPVGQRDYASYSAEEDEENDGFEDSEEEDEEKRDEEDEGVESAYGEDDYESDSEA